MSRALWAIAIGVLSVVAATVLFRLVEPPGALFVVLLIWCVALVAGAVAMFVEVSPHTGAAGGLIAALLVVAVLAMTIAAAPLAPGATRPGVRDLLWSPLLALIAVLALCALSGWYGVRVGLFVARRRKA
jgi:hypothetical protein